MLIRFAVLSAIVALAYQARHYVLNVHPHANSNVQRVTLLNQPKPEPAKKPPPEPESPQPAPEQKPIDTKQPFMKFDDYGPAGDDSKQGPRDDMLGLDAEGGPGADSFGLVGKRGGQDITTIGSAEVGGSGPHGRGRGGPMAKYAGYATMLKEALVAELNGQEALRTANYDAIIMVWIDTDGRIKRVSFVKTTGISKMDDDIRRALSTAPKLSVPPPSDMPQPIDLRITARGASPGR